MIRRKFGHQVFLFLFIIFTIMEFLPCCNTAQAETQVSGTISQNTTWTLAGSPYVVTADITVGKASEPATLTIEPGVEIHFSPGTGLYIGYTSYYYYYGVLRAQGTAENPIIFTSLSATPNPGDWKGIYFRDQASGENILEHCLIEYGGYAHNTNIYIDGGIPQITSCQIKKSSGYGVYCDKNSFSLFDNEISDNGGTAISIPHDGAVNILGNKGMGNGGNFIEVRGGTLSSDAGWKKQEDELPLVIAGDITVGRAGTPATLTLEPGIKLYFSPGAGLYIGYASYYYYYGALKAQGTAENPIIFTSAATTPAPGDWKGIIFQDQSSDTLTLLEYCVIEYGGHSHQTNILSNSAAPAIRNCTIRKGSHYGIYSSGTTGPIVENCSILENDQDGIYLEGRSFTLQGTDISSNGGKIASLPAYGLNNLISVTAMGNGSNYIEVRGGTISSDTVWRRQGNIPFVVSGDITVGRTNDAATLTIEPGIEIRFSSGTGLYIGYASYYYYYGALKVQGTAENPIIFTSAATTPAPGDWKGIIFQDQSSDTLTLLEYCVIEYGGYSHQTNMLCNSAAPTVKNCTIRKGSHYGIYSSGTTGPRVENCSILENGQDGIYLEGDSFTLQGTDISSNGGKIASLPANGLNNVISVTASGNGSNYIELRSDVISSDTIWRRQGNIPFVVSGDITVGKTNDTATLTIEPGVEIRFSSGTGLYIGYTSYYYYYGALKAQGTADQPIIFTSHAVAPTSGDWKGIFFRDQTRDDLTFLEHCLIEYGGLSHGADVYLQNAKPTIQYNTIRGSSSAGVYVNGTGCNGALIKNNNLTENEHGVYTTGESLPLINFNNIINNQSYGVYNTSNATVNAEQNWWGDPNGPGFSGDKAGGKVDYEPWLLAESEGISAPPTNSPPYLPKNPSPANGAVKVAFTEGKVTLSWTGGDPNPWDQVTYDLYLGTSQDNLIKVGEGLGSPSYQKDNLEVGTTYFWKIISKDSGAAQTTGPVWQFITQCPPPDLVVSQILLSPETDLEAREQITFTATLQNIGDGPLVDSFVVNFSIDGESIGSQTVNQIMVSGGDLQVSRNWAAKAGQHLIVVTADSTNIIAEANEENNSLSNQMPEVLDKLPPELASTNPVDGSKVKSPDKVEITLFDLDGTIDDASVIAGISVLDQNNQPLAGTTTESDDTFTFTPEIGPLPDGTYHVSLTAKDQAGNSKSYEFSFTVDNVVPASLTITGGTVKSGIIQVLPCLNQSDSRQVTLAGTREDQTSVWINNTKRIALGDGDWSVDLTLSEGNNSLEVWAQDEAGNNSQSLWVALFIDSIAPSVTSINPGHNSFLGVSPAVITIEYLEAGSGVNLDRTTKEVKNSTLTQISGTWEIADAHNLIFTPAQAFSDSSYTVNLQLEDQLGNRAGFQQYFFTLDTSAPSPPQINPVTSPTPRSSQEVSGIKEAYAAIMLNDTEIISHTQATTWQVTLNLVAGENKFIFMAKDRAGNQSQGTEVTIVYNDVPPPAVENLEVKIKPNGTSALLDWTGYDESLHGDIDYYRIYAETGNFTDTTALTEKTTVAAGHFTYLIENLTKGGTYWFAVTAVDHEGRTLTSVTPESATMVDTLAPEEVRALSVQCFEDRLIYTWQPSVNTEQDLAGYKVYFHGAQAVSLDPDQTSYEATDLSPATAYSFRITAFDESQNESSGLFLSGVTLLLNPAPIHIAAYSGYVELSWDEVTPKDLVKQYAIYVHETDFTNVSDKNPKLTVNGTSARIAGLVNNTTCYFGVTTVNISGCEQKNVTAVSGTPVADSQGPSLSNLTWKDEELTQGHILRKPGTFSLDAQDAAGVSKVEFYLDGQSLGQDNYGSPSYTCFLNIFSFADGSHTLTFVAFDTLGNSTTINYQVVITPDLPLAPVITSPSSGYTTGQAEITVTGTGEKYSEIVLFINGVELEGSVAIDYLGRFSRTITLNTGENRIQAAGRNRAGTGNLSSEVLVTLDRSLLPNPTHLEAKSQAGGLIRLTWRKAGEISLKGFNIYRATTSFASSLEAQKVNTSSVTLQEFYDLPPADGLYFYRVSSLDWYNNESELSSEVSCAADNTAPHVISVTYTSQGKYDPKTGKFGLGKVEVVFNLNEPLQSTPYFSLTPQAGLPISLEMEKLSDLEYKGFFTISENTPSGIAYAVFSGRDLVGNRGTEIDSGASLEIDTLGPSVTRLELVPDEPIYQEPDNPVLLTVTIGLHERIKEGEVPHLAYLLSGEGRNETAIEPLIETTPAQGEAQAFYAVFPLAEDAGLKSPENFAFKFRAVDELDNKGIDVLTENSFLVYQGDLPPLSAPSGLKAESLPKGKIKLSWNEVQGAVGYQLYRKSPSEIELTSYQRLADTLEFIDQTSVDGVYAYAVASVRQENNQESLSPMSSQIEVVSDSLSPQSPRNLSLELFGHGINATWEPPAYTEPVTYSLYRADSLEITSVTGLSPVLKGITETYAVDAQPSITDHCYVVTAVDKTGNESLPSNSFYLNFDLLPISSFRVVKEEDSLPCLSWAHSSSTLAGYNLYLSQDGQEVKLNQDLLTSSSYIDTGYIGDERRYTVTAVDENGKESAGRSVTLPLVKATLSDEAKIRRGLMNRLEYLVENNSSGKVEHIRIKAKLEGYDHTSEEFTLEAGNSQTIPVIAGGYSGLPDISSLITTLEVIPCEGEKVEIISSSEIKVSDGMLLVQIFNEEFIRGGAGMVHFTLENTGDEEIEIITVKNSGNAPSDEVIFYLLDKDGNVLSSQALKQNLGNMVVSLSNGLTVARIPSGGIFNSQPVEISVPATSPDDLIVQLNIAKIYYHQGKPEQVIMQGLTTRQQISLIDTSYYGEILSISPQSSYGDEDIVIMGRAVERKMLLPMPQVPMNLVISVNGFERKFSVFTDETGSFSYAFTPIPGEFGFYQVRATHPDLLDKPVQGEFIITQPGVQVEGGTDNRIVFNPTLFDLSIPKNYQQKVSIQAKSLGSVESHNLHLVYDALDQPEGAFLQGVHVTLGNSIDHLVAGSSASLDFTIWADNTAAASGKIVMKIKSDEAGEESLTSIIINTYFSEAKPVLYFTPNLVETGMAFDEQVTEIITLENKGLADLRDVSLTLVTQDGLTAPAWVHLNSSADQGSIAVGEKRPISITFTPTQNNASSGIHAFYLKVTSSNYPATNIYIYASVTQSGKGQVLFKVSDIYTGTLNQNNEVIQGLAGASIKVQNEEVLTIEQTKTTDDFGEALFSDLPAGSYKYRVTSQNHQEYIGRFWIKPDITTNQEVFLTYNLVTVEWEVVETTIQDKYEIVLTATYETDVPAAVVVAEPGSISLPEMKAGDVYQGEISLTNYGLIRAEDAQFSLPEDDENFTYEFLINPPQSLEAKQRVTLPYRVTCLRSLDQAEEDEGTGGGDCKSHFSCVRITYIYKCKNIHNGKQFTQETTTYSCFFYTTGNCGGSGGGGWGGGSGSGGIGGGGWGGIGGRGQGDPYSVKYTQGGSNIWSWPAPEPTPISGVVCYPAGERREELFDFCLPCLLDKLQDVLSLVGCTVNTVLREYNDQAVDLSLKVPGGIIDVRRLFYDNQWQWEDLRHTLEFSYQSWSSGGIASFSFPTRKKVGSGSQSTRFKDVYGDSSDEKTIETIKKSGVEYQRSGEGVYTNSIYRILQDETGFLWKDTIGNWKKFDLNGRMLSYGTRFGTLAKLLYESGEDGRLIGLADKFDQQVIWYEYNDDGRISAVRDRTNRRVEYFYTGSKLTSVRDVLGHDVLYEYNNKGRITKSTDASGRPNIISYDSDGNVSKVTDSKGNGHSFEYNYDKLTGEFYTCIKNSSGLVKEVWYDDEGETRRIDINGRTVKQVLKDGRDLIIIDEKGNVTRKELDEWDNITKIVYPDGSSILYEFEPKYNQLTKQIDQRGIITEYQYDQLGNLIKKIEASGTTDQRITTYTWDEYGQLLSATVEGDDKTESAATTLTYDGEGNLASITDPMGYETEFLEYDVSGDLLKMKDPLGYLKEFTYDAAGRLISQKGPMNSITSYEYDGINNRTAIINAHLKRFSFEYDDHFKMVKAIDPYGKCTVTEYDSDSLPIRKVDEEGKEFLVEYDVKGRLTKSIDGAGNQTLYYYDESSATPASSQLPVRIDYPSFSRRIYYDKLQRVIRQTEVLSDTNSYSFSFVYDAAGNIISETDKEGKTSFYEYDALNRLIREKDPSGGVIEYTYDNRGNLVRLKDQKGVVTRFAYDKKNNLIKETKPEGEETRYVYDAVGNRIAILDAKGQKIAYDYNGSRRLVKIRFFASGDQVNPVKTIEFTYDSVGNLLSYNDGMTSASYAYDDLRRKMSESVNYGPFTLSYAYTYYANGLKKSFTGPDGLSILYGYDKNNRLCNMNLGGNGEIAYKSFQWNSPAKIMLPGGSYAEYTYNSLMQPENLKIKDPGQNPIMTYTYNYLPSGNIASKTTEHGQYTYQYDQLYRMVSATNPVAQNEVYTYDAVGNRLTTNEVEGNWAYNKNCQLLGFSNLSFEYDKNGNCIEKRIGDGVVHYHYSVDDRLMKVENQDGSAIAEYYYDPFGRRLWKDVAGVKTYFFYSDGGLIGEYDANGQVIKTYGYEPDSLWTADPVFLRQDDQTFWYLNDRLGAPQKIIDSSGRTKWAATYESFGQSSLVTTEIENNLRLPGQYLDAETGLSYNWHRYYDPATGRYLSKDPVNFAGNPYTYTSSNPLNMTDAEGLCIDPTGLTDLVNAGIYALRGNWSEAALSAIAIIPFVGDAIGKGGKLVKRGLSHVDDVGAAIRPALNHADEVGDLVRPALNHVDEVGDTLRQGGRTIDEAHDAASFARYKAELAEQEIKAATPVGSALKNDPCHRAPSFVVDDIGKNGQFFTIKGGDGKSYNLTQMPGNMNGQDGIFEWLVDGMGNLNHQRFIPGGRITGSPNQVPGRLK